jgi:hypothetical protein
VKAVDVLRAWAPDDAQFGAWVKPVLFARLDETHLKAASRARRMPTVPSWIASEVVQVLEEHARTTGGPYRRERVFRDTAIVVDLPSADGLELSVALTAHGVRPIPLYNALPSEFALIDMDPIMRLLAGHAQTVAALPVSAPPVFVLDARRMGRTKVVRAGRFDNRSVCRSADFPSAARFEEAGITRILLLCDELEDDLQAIALEWQDAGMHIWWKLPSLREPVEAVRIRRPSLVRRTWNRVLEAALPRRADGSYGKMIEVSSSS